MKVSQSVLTVGVVGAFVSIAWSAQPLVPTVATQNCLTANPGLKAMAQGERLVSLFGVAFATDADPATDTDQFVANFLNVPANVDALGVDDAVLELKDSITIRNGKYKVYTYTQKIEGLPVHGSVVKIPVLLGATEKIGYAGMHLTQHPEAPLPPDLKSDADAIAIVANSPAFVNLTDFTQAEKVIYEDVFGDLHRVWRFSGYNGYRSYRFFVDTNTGEITDVVNEVEEADVSGTVKGWGTPGVAAHSANNLPQEMALPGVQVSLIAGDSPACPSDDGTVADGPIFSSAAEGTEGEYGPLNGTLPARATSRLVGEWVTVLDCAGGSVCESPFCLPAALLPLGGGLIACEDVPLGHDPNDPVDPVFNRPPDPLLPHPDNEQTEFGATQVNAFIGVQKTHDWFKDLQPASIAIDINLTVVVNSDFRNTNAAFFPNPLHLNFGKSGPCGAFFCTPGGTSNCNNWAFSTIISHEYGHFIRSNVVGVGIGDGAFSEGTADIVATLLWNTPEQGLDAWIDRYPTYVRNVDEGNIQLICDDTFPTPSWCVCTSIHCQGQALAGAFWDLQKDFQCCADDPYQRCSSLSTLTECTLDSDCAQGQQCILGKGLLCCEGSTPGRCDVPVTVCGDSGDCQGAPCIDRPTEELFADFLFITDGGLDQSVLVEVLMADDDDADLSNGTPNEIVIRGSFEHLHGWRALTGGGGGGVNVTWIGPHLLGLFPEEGVDYFVETRVSPPTVTLKTTQALNGTPVDRWIVGRAGDSLGTVFANWDGPAHNIVVQVGHETDNDFKCSNVNVIEIPAQSSNHWSSIELHVLNRVPGHAQCYPVASGLCEGGTNNGNPCTVDSDCPGGLCTLSDLS